MIARTLLIQGPTLPHVVRRLGLVGPDPAQDRLTEGLLYQQAARAGLVTLEEITTGDEPESVIARLRHRGLERADAVWESLGGDGETPSQVFARLRSVMLDSERAAVIRARDDGTAPDDVLREVLDALDVEESVLINSMRSKMLDRGSELVPIADDGLACAELGAAGRHDDPLPGTPDHQLG